MSRTVVRSGVMGVVVGVMLTGCIVAEPPGPVMTSPPPAPPPAQVEVVPVAPGPAYVWVPGHYGWRGHAYVWVPGVYALPAQPGYVWVAPHWAARRGGWVWVEGRWRAR